MRTLRRLGRDLAYVLAGFPIAVFSFSLLLALTVTSVATAVIWVGALLMPITLVVASGFAELDRSRLRAWGADIPPVAYRPLGPGIAGKLRILADPRRWLDLVFEMLITFPLRLVTCVIAVVWTLLGPAGVTYFIWSLLLPTTDGGLTQLLRLLWPAVVPETSAGRYVLESAGNFGLGLVFLLTLPVVARGLAWLDATLSTVLLGAAAESHDPALRHPGAAPPRKSPASFSGRAWSRIGAGFTAVVLLAVGWPVISAVYQVNVAVAMVLVTAHCAAIMVTLRWPWVGLGLSILAAALLMPFTAAAGISVWPWPVTTMLTQFAVFAVAALARPWYVAASGWSASAVLTLGVLLTGMESTPESGPLANAIVYTSVSAGVVVIGALLRIWILNAGRLEAAERSSAEQDRRRKELEDRNRIARELHDVVAHSLSVISVQATTAQYRNPDIDDAARGEFEDIAASSRQALSEMRMLLNILRGADDAPTAPEPGLEDIESLISTTRASGTPIRYTGLRAGHAIGASSAVGLAAYRTVQEALSNALRHAPGASIHVTVAERADRGQRRLRVEVVNGPPPEPVTDPAPGAGLGLGGIRERAAAVGGQAETGPTDDGGFAVRASLPL
ncbi:sensor histidine kinase [Nesterenkonia alba]|uniref:sensor histidine kinase n=1 Tax=Nesterenkonia alba TaxID=515814 RepID=UPI0005278F40|nr:sensor histidine kinase [Nesterenkonia alba]